MLQGAKETHHLLCVLAGYGAALVRQHRNAAALENHRAGENRVVPPAIPLPGDLYLFFAGVSLFEALGQDDRRPADADQLFCLFVDAADSELAVLPAGRLPQVLGCALNRHREGVVEVFQVQGLRRCQQFFQLVLGSFLAQVEVQGGGVFLPAVCAGEGFNPSIKAGIFQGVSHLVQEGLAALVGFLVDVEHFYPFEALRPFRLERGSARNAQGGVAEEPKGLCVTLSLHQDTAACDL